LDPHGNVWKLPYQLCLNHTVEEIAENCENYQDAKAKLGEFEERARLHLGLLEKKDKEEFFEPVKLTQNEFIKKSLFVFIALHGGDGENGVLQKRLELAKVKFNGPDDKVSRLCMDKFATSQFIKRLKINGVGAIPGKVVSTIELFELNGKKIEELWQEMTRELEAETLIVKPRADGCTTGIAHLYSYKDLAKYIDFVKGMVRSIPKDTFTNQADMIDMPTNFLEELLFEKFVVTDILRVQNNKIKHLPKTGWTEITVGVIEKEKRIKSLNPSITVVEGEVLTVEEKFQGGTGVNITPPPASIIKPVVLAKIKKNIEVLAKQIGIKGYSRIDSFVNMKTGDLQIIEVNTLPGLTPSTVFYHQALAENPAILPHDLLELLIQNKGY